MKPYLIGFGLVFIGFILGFFTAMLCVVAGRAEEMEKEILRRKGGTS